jgi:NAD(P)H-flavin reductase/ferredoxin
MATIHFGEHGFPAAPGETVLDCLLRNGVAVSHSCKAGACQSCMIKCTAGAIPAAAQSGLKDTLRAQGYFLACSHRPAEDLTVTLAGSDVRTQAWIAGLEPLNSTVLRVRLQTKEPLSYYPGQFVGLFREDGLARSYSLASLPHENELELHVRRIAGGAMSEWLHTGACVQTPVSLQGPSGNCFYTAGASEQPIVLAGAGTGLAPLYGIARDALFQAHTGPVWLFHGALTPDGLYLTKELCAVEKTYPNFHYIRSVLRDSGATGIETGALDQCILSRFKSLAGWKGYVCGDPALVNLLRKKLFLAGMASKAIYADSFIPSS